MSAAILFRPALVLPERNLAGLNAGLLFASRQAWRARLLDAPPSRHRGADPIPTRTIRCDRPCVGRTAATRRAAFHPSEESRERQTLGIAEPQARSLTTGLKPRKRTCGNSGAFEFGHFELKHGRAKKGSGGGATWRFVAAPKSAEAVL